MSAVPIYPQQPSLLELGIPGGAVPALSDLYAPIEEELARVCRLFDDTLLGDLPFLNDLCDHVRGYRGKMLRPTLVLLTFPGELSVQIGLNLKKASPHELTFVAAYTNGYIYYAPTAEQLRNVGGAQEDSDCLLAPEWQKVFEEKAVEMLRTL